MSFAPPRISVIRYPGSKAKLAGQIFRAFPDEMKYELIAHAAQWEYREPFFGAGAIGFRVLFRLPVRCRVWINDIDPGIAALWEAVLKYPTELAARVAYFTPTANAFFKYKEEDGRDDLPLAERALRKLALHRMSYSGFGAKSGGPLGGKTQGKSEYSAGCRWNAETIKLSIMRAHERLAHFEDLRITSVDFRTMFRDVPPKCFMYLDPPYYAKGGALYKFAMAEEDHRDLAQRLRLARCHWVLSYDDHPTIRSLYRWADFHELEVKYSNALAKGVQRPKNHEVIITPQRLERGNGRAANEFGETHG